MRKRTLLGSLGLLAGIAATTVTAEAQTTPGFAVNRFEPSERGSEWFMLESLDFRGKARPVIGIVGDYMYRPFVLRRDPGDPDRVTNSIVRNVFTIHPGFSFVLAERLRIAGSIPVVLFQDSGVPQNVVRMPSNEQAIGDVRLGADFRLLGADHGGPFRMAVGAQVWLPTGSESNYTSDGNVRVAPRLLFAGDIGGNTAFTYAAKAAFLFRGSEDVIGRGRTGHELQLAASVGVRLGKRLVIGPEWYMNTVVSNLGPINGREDQVFGREETAMEWLGGAHYTLPGDVRIGAAAGTGLGKGYGNPEARVLANLEFMPRADKKETCDDRDADGVCDKEDSCPDVQGARTSNPATNGCPPDRDGDGVTDDVDACVDIPGEKTSDPKTNGCPPDKDGDGIFDRDDACPDVAGVKSDDPKKNGCPPDSDGDGILDNVDACPDKPGIKTDDPKTNGCPDPDRDKDGVLNDVDACPDEPGKADPDPKKNGCPKAFVKDGQIKILDQVKFKYNSAAIEAGPFSEEILTAVLEQVQKHSEVKGIRIEGHTDNKGSPAYNKTLSKNRANSVAQWLVNHGVDTSTLAVEGYGQEKPIDTNDTDAGRANNRRVEFHILEAAPEKPVKLKAKAIGSTKKPGPGTPKPVNPPGTKPGTTNGTGKDPVKK